MRLADRCVTQLDPNHEKPPASKLVDLRVVDEPKRVFIPYHIYPYSIYVNLLSKSSLGCRSPRRAGCWPACGSSTIGRPPNGRSRLLLLSNADTCLTRSLVTATRCGDGRQPSPGTEDVGEHPTEKGLNDCRLNCSQLLPVFSGKSAACAADISIRIAFSTLASSSSNLTSSTIE